MRHILLLLALFAPAAVGAQKPSSLGQLVDQLTQCRTVSGEARRLACFDRLAADIATARSSGDLLVLDRREVVERKRGRFGLSNPPGEVFGGGDADRATAVTQIDTTVRSASSAGNQGRWNLALANGMTWQVIDSLPFAPRTGAAIRIKAAPLGGFRASLPGGRSVLVKRLR